MPTELINPERLKGFTEKVQLAIISHDFWWNLLGKAMALITACIGGLNLLQKWM